MSDIVERLRALVIIDEVRSDNSLGREAAAEIERLRAALREAYETAAEIERLRAALRFYADWHVDTGTIARAALVAFARSLSGKGES